MDEMKSIWEQCLAFTRNYGDRLPSIFNDIPRMPITNVSFLTFFNQGTNYCNIQTRSTP